MFTLHTQDRYYIKVIYSNSLYTLMAPTISSFLAFFFHMLFLPVISWFIGYFGAYSFNGWYF